MDARCLGRPNQLRWGPAFQMLSLESIFNKYTAYLLTLGLFKFNFQRTGNSLLSRNFLTIIEVFEIALLHMFILLVNQIVDFRIQTTIEKAIFFAFLGKLLLKTVSEKLFRIISWKTVFDSLNWAVFQWLQCCRDLSQCLLVQVKIRCFPNPGHYLGELSHHFHP